MKLQWPQIRNLTLFLSGLAGVAHETIITASERPSLLIVFTAMMGLPAVIRRDEKKSPDEEK